MSAPSFSFAQSNPSAPQGNGAPVDLAAAGGVVTGSATNPIIEVPSVVNGSGPLGGGSGAQATGGASAGAVAGNGLGAVGAGGATGAVAGPVANAGAAGASVTSGGVSSAASDSASVGAGRNLNISMASIAPTIRNGVGLFGNSGALTAVGGVDAIDGRGAGGAAIAVGTVSGRSATAASGGAAASTGTSGPSGTAASGSGPAVVRTSSPNTALPNASLFQLQPDPGSRYLIATDSVFTRGAGFVSSDQLLGAFNGDLTLKRLGDGFYEQKLIREQIANLTGYRFLAGFSDDEAQYSALMNAGVTFAKQYGLTPGIALSAAQMAQLTSDIVWLVEQTVTLPDGSSQRVLVPQVYVRVQPGDIDGSGSLLSAGAMVIEGAGDLNNQGTIAGRTMVSIDAQNVNNLGGRIAGGSVAVNARNDLNNIGGSITAHDAAVLTAGNDINIQTTTRSASGAGASITNIDRIAGVYVSNPGGTLIASAGNDVNLIGAALVSAGTVAVGAGHNVNLGTVTESSSRVVVGGTRFALAESQSREVGSAIVGQDSVRIAAGNDLNIRAGMVASIDGALVASAGHDINLTAGQASASLGVLATSATRSRLKKSSTSNFDSTSVTDVLSSSLSGNTVALVAGNDINAQAAQLRAEGAMSLAAGRDVNLTTATQTTQDAHASQSKSSATGLGRAIGGSLAMTGGGVGLIAGAAVTGSKSANGASAGSFNEAVGTTVSAGSLQVVSGRDTTLQGATVVADHDITMVAGRNLTIESASQSSVEASSQSSRTSGMVGTWYNPSVGNLKSFDANAGTGTTQSSSQVASLQGNVTLVAGETYRQTASSVLAAGQAGALVGGDVNILAKNVVINEAANTSQSVALGRQSSTILGGSASVAGISTDTVMGMKNTLNAMGDTDDSRMQALGAANLALSGKQVADTVQSVAAGGGVGFKVSVNLSRNKSEYSNAANDSQSVGSSIVGANNVNIVATGGGKDSNIHAVGSTIAAGNTVNLAADNAITLEASKNTFDSAGQNKSSGASVGVGYAMGSQNGFTIELAASQGKGHANQNDVTYNNTRVSGGKEVNIVSGGDLAMKGAVVEGNRVTADVGGNLNVESLQDTSVGQSRQSSSGLNASLCIPPICYGVSTVGGSVASAKADGLHVSVGEQSGIKAGDGGFEVKVKGDTTLKGAVIESTQAAIDEGKNSFKTDGQLTLSDLENVSTSKGSSYAVSGSVGFMAGGASDQQAAMRMDKDMSEKQVAAASSTTPGGGAGVGSSSTSVTSVTKSGISGIAGDESVRTGDTTSAGTLVKDWNTQTIVRDVQAQAVITQEFTQRSKESAASYFADARDALTKKASETDDPKELASIQQQAKDLNQQERVVGVVISLLGNPASSMLVGNALSEAAQSMRNSTIENSSIFAGVTDGTTVLDNISGPSEGINGDNKKTGGVRVDLNLLCGKDNGRCVTDTDGSLQLNAQGLAQFDRAAAGMSLAEFLQTPDGLKMSGPTGGIQGSVGTLFGIPYAPGSWQDKLIESFGGPHDFIGGYLSGLYDAQGNIKQNMTEAERFIYDNFVTTAAIPAAVPFALMQAVPPQIWQNALILIQGMKAAK